MTTLQISSGIVLSYPEQNPFEMDPPPFNLTPETSKIWARERELDTPEFIAAARAQASKSGCNPLWTWFGTNPLVIYDERIKKAVLPFKNYVVPSPVQEALLSSDFEYLERVNPKGNTPLYKVRIGDDIRLLKIFFDRDPDEEFFPSETGMSMIRFRREKDAYAHLIHYGVCDNGSVPRCYGWLELSRSSCDKLYDFSLATKDQDDFLRISLKKNRRRPKALLLEYLSPVERLSVQNITPTIADTALRALCTIHSAFVRHGDIETRNILLLPEGRVVWVDFDNAQTPLENNPTLTRQLLMDELADGWSLFYTSLLADQRIGFKHWVY